MEIFSRNRKTNKNIALIILGLLIADAIGILSGIGFNISTLGFAGWSLKQILLVFGLIWIAFGLWKFKF